MVHKAYNLRKVQDRMKNMTSIANLGEGMVVLGMSDGCLSVFKVNLDETDKQIMKPSGFYKPNSKTGKSPIVQLIPLLELNMLLALVEGSGSILQFQILPEIRLLSEVVKVSGVTCMAAKKERDKYHVAAGKRTKLFVLEYRREKKGFAVSRELSLPEVPKSIAWNVNGVFTGYKRECSWINVANQSQVKNLASSSSVMVSMPVTEEVLLLRDREGVSMDPNADPSRKIRIQWHNVPQTLAYSYPYILGLGDSGIEVRAFPPDNAREQQQDMRCEDVAVDHPRMSSLSNYTDVDAAAAQRASIRKSSEPDHHAVGRGAGGSSQGDGGDPSAAATPQPPIFITSNSNGLYVLEPVPFTEQVDELTRQRDFHTALTLSSILTPRDITDGQLRRALVLHGFHLFSEKHFVKSMRQFKLARVDPRIVVKVFSMLPTYVANAWRPSEEDERAITHARSTALAEMSDRFAAAEQLKSLLKDIRGTYASSAKEEDPLKLDTSEPGMIRASVDTALLHCLLLTAEEDVIPFLEKPNRCVLEDCEKILRQETPCKYADIVALYRSKGLNRRALTLLRALGATGSFSFTDQPSGGPQADAFASAADEASESPEVQQHKKLGLDGTIAYLKRLNGADSTHGDLILEFSTWVLQSSRCDVEKKLSMFWSVPASNASAVGAVSPRVVLAHLKKVLPNEVATHTLYLERMLSDPQLSKLQECRQNVVHEALIHSYLELVNKLSSQPGLEEEERKTRMRSVGDRLQKFLRASDMFNVELMKKTLSEPHHAHLFFTELAIVYCKLEQHDEALYILSHKLNSFEQALEYCDTESRERPADAPLNPSSPSSRGKEKRYHLHSILLKLLLHPPSDSPPHIDAALRLLKAHPDKVNCLEALRMLPPETPVHDLAPWITQVLKDVALQQRETRLTMNLSKSEHQQVAVERAVRQKQSFQINPDTICSLCRAKIGINSIVAYYPNKVLVHYNCAMKEGGSMSVCPVTKQTFSSLDEFCSDERPRR
eukprot:Rhum_TRINITY_DN14790_c30_g1::Rhum_TRINITY_DN14790_c30_g1_i1::g.118207::m.118207/K20183/VPS39, VAM6; Vam6/Vps39-like protein vacuolar protein sorting-associated protein 39